MKIAIVGASLAGYKTASALREFGSVDEILLVGEEGLAPYDRPPLSKAVLTEGLDFADVSLESSGDVPDVDYLLGARAESLDLEANSVQLEGGERISYDALVVATGASARRLPWPDLGGVCYLRTFEDALELRKRLESSHRVVVVGGGFIGAEVAAAARHLGRAVTVLEASVAPLSRVLGADVGNALGRLHDRHGVEIKCGAMVTGVEGEGGRVSGVHLATGEVVPADTVVVGIGAVPGTSWLESSGLLVDDGLVCDEYCRAEGTENVYAVGDVARWLNPFYGETMRVEHWTNAVEQAASVAQTILGDPAAVRAHSLCVVAPVRTQDPDGRQDPAGPPTDVRGCGRCRRTICRAVQRRGSLDGRGRSRPATSHPADQAHHRRSRFRLMTGWPSPTNCSDLPHGRSRAARVPSSAWSRV